MSDTEDLVQVALIRAFDHIDGFEPMGEGAFLAYLRRIVVNLIKDHGRATGNKPEQKELTEDLPDGGPTPLTMAIGQEALERYERALESLPKRQREAVILRIELGYSYPEIADVMGWPTSSAARMAVTRAVERVAELMQDLLGED